MSKIEKQIELLANNLHKIPDEFWVRTEEGSQAIWLLDQDDGTADSYETAQERFGLTRDGRVIWGYSSGCSCWDGWSSDDYCPTMSYKEFDIDRDFLNKRVERRYNTDEMVDAEAPIRSNLNDFLVLVSENPTVEQTMSVQNAEIRRYMIKRIGYENIKELVKAEVLHIDGTSELLRFENGEIYVKVKDSSTDREYLLFVEGKHKTCKSAIAWTFGLEENEYNPIIET